MAGSISSGCVESDLHAHMLEVLETRLPRVVHYGISDDMAHGVGLACGGEIDVLIAEHARDDPAWTRLSELVGTRSAAALCTALDGVDAGRHLLVESDGRRTGSLGSVEADAAAGSEVGPLLVHGGTRVFGLPGESTSAFAEAFLPSPRLALVGSTPVSAALCHFASRTGFEVFIIEPRDGLLRPGWFADAADVIREWPEAGLARVDLDPYVSVVALAHEERLDVPSLASALAAGCGYVGLLGGRRTRKQRIAALSALDVDAVDIERIHGPTGLDIGATTPEEIAVSILAEIIGVRSGKVA